MFLPATADAAADNNDDDDDDDVVLLIAVLSRKADVCASCPCPVAAASFASA